MIVTTARETGGLPRSLFSGVPVFDSRYVVFAEKIVCAHYFIDLGKDFYQSKQISAVFHAPGWKHGYDDGDVARTPLMVRSH